MTIFFDNDYKCHLENDGTMRAVETNSFDGKCRQYIEGYRFIPDGETWTRSDGEVFRGEMMSPWRDYSILADMQAQYEEMLVQQVDMQAALEAIYGGITDDGT